MFLDYNFVKYQQSFYFSAKNQANTKNQFQILHIYFEGRYIWKEFEGKN